KIKLYINGLLVNSGQAPLETDKSDQPLQIGAWGGQKKQHFFHGLIDVIVVRNKAYRQSELQDSIHQRLDIEPIPADVVAYWRLDSSLTFQLEDLSGKNNHGYLGLAQAHGASLIATPQSVMNLNDSFVKKITIDGYKGILGSGPRTIEFWINIPESEKHGAIIAWGKTTDHGLATLLEMALGDGKLNISAGAAVYKRFPPPLNDGKWHHIASSFAGKTLSDTKIYIDGKLIETIDVESFSETSMVATEAGDEFLRMGHALNGQITDIRIWDVARSANEIVTNMGRVLSGNEAGLVGYWRAEKLTDGKLKDFSPHQRHGTLESSVTIIDAAESNLQLFEPVTPADPTPPTNEPSRVEVNAIKAKTNLKLTGYKGILGNAPRTFEAWVKVAEDSPHYGAILIWGSTLGTGQHWRLRLDAHKLTLCVDSSSTSPTKAFIRSNTSLADNDWHHIACSFPGGNLKDATLYIDGVPEASASANLDRPINTVAEYSVSISTTNFHGQMAEIRLWDVARSESEIKRHKDRSLHGGEDNLIGYWPLLEGSGTTTADHSGNGRNATLPSANWVTDTGLRLTPPAPQPEPDKTLKFDGVDDYLSIERVGAELLKQNAFTIETWLKIDGFAANGEPNVIFATDGVFSEGNRFLQIDAQRLQFGVYPGFFWECNWAENDITLETGKWYHLALSYNANTKQRVKAFLGGTAYHAAVAQAHEEAEGEPNSENTLEAVPLRGHSSLEQDLQSPSPSVSGFFGQSVNATDKWAIIGAPQEDLVDDQGNEFNKAGAAYIIPYNAERGLWQADQIISLTSDNPQNAGIFGRSVVIDQNMALVTAPEENDSVGNTYEYHYNLATKKWDHKKTYDKGTSVDLHYDPTATEETKSTSRILGMPRLNKCRILLSQANSLPTSDGGDLINPTGNNGDQFGHSVAIVNGRWALVGAPETNGKQGKAYLFKRQNDSDNWDAENNGGPWDAPHTTLSPPPEASDKALFGSAVALHSVYGVIFAIVGAPEEEGLGAAYIYKYDESSDSWILTSSLPNPAPREIRGFGSTVSLNGYWAAVGAEKGIYSYLYHYDVNANSWTEDDPVPYQTAAPARAVALSPYHLLVGADKASGGGKVQSGRVHTFAFPDLPEFDRPITSSVGKFGHTIALNERWAVARLDEEKVAIYTLNPFLGKWSSAAPYILNHPDPQAQPNSTSFGFSFALNDRELIVGSPATYGDDGQAYLFKYDSNSDDWEHKSSFNEDYQLFLPTLSGKSREFGAGVAMTNHWAIVGGYDSVHVNNEKLTFLRKYDSITGVWQSDIIMLPGAAGFTEYYSYGKNVALTDKWALVGANQASPN
ncbi:MAG: LamG-like jellyroll fold domain-containing protein, partial [Chloroflexota bacterium]